MISKKVDIRQYNRRGNPCFAEACLVELANGEKRAVEKLRKGMEVWTPLGQRKIVAVVATEVKDYGMCRIGELLITVWHPISANGQWVFPIDMAKERETYSGKIYSILLERDENAEAHAVRVGGQIAVTLGHGIIGRAVGRTDVRAHYFLGDYEKVKRSLDSLELGGSGLHISGGMEKDEETGLVCGFIPVGKI